METYHHWEGGQDKGSGAMPNRVRSNCRFEIADIADGRLPTAEVAGAAKKAKTREKRK